MRIRTAAGLLASGLTLTLGTALAVPATAGAADDPGPTERKAQTAKAARAALAAVEAAVAGETDDASRRDLTLALRDLFVAKHALRGDDRAHAESLLLRPTTPPDDPNDPRDIYYGEDADLQTRCGDTFCLHWVEDGEHAATPEFAATAFETIAHVAGVYAAAGFRAPLPDEGQEGDTRTDFYLGDLDQYGALGFCRSDADGPIVGSAWYAYCGFDNDYANSPWLDPTSLLQVSVAHEYFHAIQFAYDAEDDGWLMESTATSMEDELYDDVNDNAFFLNYGQMGDPETLGYPLAGPSTPQEYVAFAAANQHTVDVYEEAAEQSYPTAPNTLATVQLSRTAPAESRTALLDHLTSATGAVYPFPGSRELRVRVDLGDADVARAAITVHRVDGTNATSYVPVNRQGKGSLTVPFAANDVSSVEVTLANGSTEMVGCGSFSMYSCGGFSPDDGLVVDVRFQAVG